MALNFGGHCRTQVQKKAVAYSAAHAAGLGGMGEAEGASANHAFSPSCEDRPGHRRSMELTLLWRACTTMAPRPPAAAPGGEAHCELHHSTVPVLAT